MKGQDKKDSAKPPDGDLQAEPGKVIHDWKSYEMAVEAHNKRMQCRSPGWFATGTPERFYRQCIACPLTSQAKKDMPPLTLPLRVHIVRSRQLGCSPNLNGDSVRRIVQEMNSYWSQAAIAFRLTEDGVIEHNLDETHPQHVCEEAEHFIRHELTRGPDGAMRNKDRRRRVFLDTLLQPLHYQDATDTYDLYFFDMIGMGSQGCCISRPTHTLIMGERSTKGYPQPTRRPHACLAKTMAHELGHALELGHPSGRRFRDGTSQCEERGRNKNLMCGGADKKGGGGGYLEPWQICLARDEAMRFLKGCKRRRRLNG